MMMQLDDGTMVAAGPHLGAIDVARPLGQTVVLQDKELHP